VAKPELSDDNPLETGNPRPRPKLVQIKPWWIPAALFVTARAWIEWGPALAIALAAFGLAFGILLNWRAARRWDRSQQSSGAENRGPRRRSNQR